MKGPLGTSAVLHALVLAVVLLKFGAPEQLQVAPTELLPVSIVPIEEMTNIQQGDKKTPKKEKSSTQATKNQTKVDNAENAGENTADLKSPPTPTTKPNNVEVAAAPPKTEKPLPKTDPVPTETKEIQKEVEEATKATEVAPVSKPKVDVKPEPKPDVKPTPKPDPAPKPDPTPTKTPPPETTEPTPNKVPAPAEKPTPKPEKKTEDKPSDKKPDPKKTDSKPTETAQAETAKTTDKTKTAEKKTTAKSSSSKASDFNADDISALLNKQEASGGGAKRSTEVASLGGEKKTGGSKLSQSEMDALKGIIEGNWNVIPGTESAGIQIKVTFKLDESGAIVGEPEVTVTGASGSAANMWKGGAVRAVKKSAPFKNLPADKYDAWSEVEVNFDPTEFM